MPASDQNTPRDAYRLTEGQKIQVDVPVKVTVACDDGATYGDPPTADLVWGKHWLGRFALEHVGGRLDSDGAHYLATLRRVGQSATADREPVDDDFARYIRARRDSYRKDLFGDTEAWFTLDALLDDYRDHRVTGTPLDQDVQFHEEG